MDNKKISLKKVLITILAILVIWVIVGTVDYLRVASFERPVFSIPTLTADDGGSGTYQGFGYSFEIKGNFMPDDELPGVTHYKYYLLGNFIKEELRD